MTFTAGQRAAIAAALCAARVYPEGSAEALDGLELRELMERGRAVEARMRFDDGSGSLWTRARVLAGGLETGQRFDAAWEEGPAGGLSWAQESFRLAALGRAKAAQGSRERELANDRVRASIARCEAELELSRANSKAGFLSLE